MSNEKKEITAEEFWNSQPAMKSIPDAINEFYELKRKEQVYVSVHGESRDENAFLEACKPLMKYLCENYHPHVTVIIDGTRAELVEGLKTAKCEDYIRD
jgi:2'-5' RNA ligase